VISTANSTHGGIAPQILSGKGLTVVAPLDGSFLQKHMELFRYGCGLMMTRNFLGSIEFQ
jgi:hypothetical protein